MVYCKYPYEVSDIARDLGTGFSVNELKRIQEAVNTARTAVDDNDEYNHDAEDAED
jgi:hypothetical protein